MQNCDISVVNRPSVASFFTYKYLYVWLETPKSFKKNTQKIRKVVNIAFLSLKTINLCNTLYFCVNTRLQPLETVGESLLQTGLVYERPQANNKIH